MRLLKFIPILFVLTLYNSNSFAEEKKKNCSLIKAETGVELYEKIRCKMGEKKGEGLGEKLKSIFKKKDNQ